MKNLLGLELTKRYGSCCYLGFGMILFQRRWLTARIFPSVSLNQAVFAPPPVAMLFFILIPGMSYSSNTTPRALSSATSASTSSTCQNAWLALEVPAFFVGYMKTSAPPHS